MNSKLTELKERLAIEHSTHIENLVEEFRKTEEKLKIEHSDEMEIYRKEQDNFIAALNGDLNAQNEQLLRVLQNFKILYYIN
jgi:hypothetical protein